MSVTINTSSTSYLPVSELLKRCDWRTIGDFCSDTGSRLPQANLATDPNVAALLLDASGIVEAASLAGNRYQPADLNALTGAGQAFLYRLVADLFVGLMVRRRPDKQVPIPPAFEQAMELIGKLRDGQAIFSFQETMDAGVQGHHIESAAEVENRDLMTFQADRYFGRRANRSNG